MKGTILYECRICGQEDIPITEVVESVYCPTCNKKIELIQSSKEYLRQFFSENGVAGSCRNATQDAQNGTGCTEGNKNRDE